MSESDRHIEYTEDFITALQWMWGDGYLSPGGPQEVSELLHGVEVRNLEILDIGCGLGAIDILLVRTYGAKSVVGIDIEQPLVDHARRRTAAAGLDESVRFQLVDPGPLPFEDKSFDLVFSKDAIIHISDKQALYEDVIRVLKPGGIFVGSDWLRGGEGEFSSQALEWFEVLHLNFDMINLEQTRLVLQQAGFERVQLRDRNAWYRAEIRNELKSLSGHKYEELARLVGPENAALRLRSSTLKQQVIERGELCPTHFIGYKPASR